MHPELAVATHLNVRDALSALSIFACVRYALSVRTYYSGYVHADGLSGVQIVDAKTARDQIGYIETHMTTVMMVMSKLIIEYANKFSEARAICDKNPAAFYRAQVWSGVASRIP